MISGDKLALMGDKYIGIPYTKIDCQQLWENALADAGLSVNLPGSNAWYRKIRSEGWVGTPEECKAKFGRIPPGAALFILKQDGGEPAKYKADGLGNASHIGLYTGRTEAQMMATAQAACKTKEELRALNKKAAHGSGAIAGSSVRGCVATSNFSGKTIRGGWNCVGLWNKIDYGLIGQQNTSTEVVKMKMIVMTDNGGGVNLRAQKSTGSALVAKIPEGATVEAAAVDSVWHKVTYAGRTGYCMSRFLVAASEGAEPATSTDLQASTPGYTKTLTTAEFGQVCEIRDQLLEMYNTLKQIVGVG